MLEFRHLLLGLSEMMGSRVELVLEGGFDSRAVASYFRMPVKHASNDLRRLWRMGFLKRSRRRRPCLTPEGRLCNRGFEYKHTLSTQGTKYVKWLKEWKAFEDLCYAKLTSEVLSYLPDELKDGLSMLSLAKAARRYRGPNRNTNLLDSNAVPVIHLLTERMRLRSENGRLELENAIQKLRLENLQRTITNYEEQNRSLYSLLAQALVWAVAHKNSADDWRDLFTRAFSGLVKLHGPLEALSTLGRDWRDDANTANPADCVDPPLFDPRTGISDMPVVIKGTGISPFSFRTSWSEHYGKTFALRDVTPQGPERILATWQINPESARALVESAIA
jgi:hypothetical protein